MQKTITYRDTGLCITQIKQLGQATGVVKWGRVEVVSEIVSCFLLVLVLRPSSEDIKSLTWWHNPEYKALCFSEGTVTFYQSTWYNNQEDTKLRYYILHISKNSWPYMALIFYITRKSFISVWSAKFSSRRVAVSPLPSKSRVADETQQLFCPYHFTYRVNQSTSSNRFFTG